MKDIPSLVTEGDKILDVSLSLDKTPTMMRSRDSTPTKSLRFKEPRKIPSDLANDENKQSKDESNLSNETNETNDSFFSLGSNMDVDSPRVMPRDFAESPLVTRSFPDRVSNSSKENQSPVISRSQSGLSSSSLSPVTKAKLEQVLQNAEDKLKVGYKKAH